MTESSSPKRYPGETDEAYPKKYDIRAMPPQPKELKPGQLPEKEIREFLEEGFVLVKNYFTKEELDACRREVGKCVEDLAQVLYKAGKIKNLYSDAGLFDRLTLIEKEYPDANVLLHKPITKHQLYEGFRNIWANERLLNLVEQLIGPEIMGNPVWNIRPKVPNNEATEIPWHQDAGYTANELYGLLVPTVWIPLLDVKKEHGCVEVVKGGHKTGKVARHRNPYKGTWYLELPEDEMEKTLGVDLSKDKVLCEMNYGDLLLFNNMVPHRGLDLRYMAPSQEGGWYGPKGVLLRSQKTPVSKIDWDGFLEQNVQMGKKEEAEGEPMFDPIYTSAYFLRWEITDYNNKHYKRFFEQEERRKRQIHA